MFGYGARAMWMIVIIGLLIAIYLITLLVGIIKNKKGIYTETNETAVKGSRLDEEINYDANWNDTPWVSKAENKSEAEKLFEKAYARAPRRSNLKRIIWQEHKNNDQRKQDVINNDIDNKRKNSSE